jgi:site-specific DNA-methyltransferase (adenine-specific)
MKLIDLVGHRFTRLLVLRRGENNDQGHARWFCRCDCGKEVQVRGTELIHGKVKSCGCLLSENACLNGQELWTTHGLIAKNKRLYTIWKGIKQRCYNQNSPSYKRYGGKGIVVCDEWLIYPPFYSWAIHSGYSDELTLDRIDNNGNYEPKNCRWATWMQQENNRSNNKPKVIDLSVLPPPFKIRTVTLYNCDCADLMKCYPNKYFDLADVDPPYGMGGRWISTGNSGFTLRPDEVDKMNKWDFIPGREYFDELKRVSKDYMVWGGNYFAKYLHNTNSILIWDKQQRGFTLADGEMCWTSHTNRPLRIINCGQSIRAADKKNAGGRTHPTQKPIYLYRKVLEMYAKPGYKILDTHLGSGTHAIACLEMGYELIACEIDKEYYDKAVEKIRNWESSHQEMFDEKERASISLKESDLF